MRHFLNINKLSTKEMLLIIKQGHFLKKNYGRKFLEEKKILAMIFEKPSTRTRVSFEVGMKKLNGDVKKFFSNERLTVRRVIGNKFEIVFKLRFLKLL